MTKTVLALVRENMNGSPDALESLLSHPLTPQSVIGVADDRSTAPLNHTSAKPCFVNSTV